MFSIKQKNSLKSGILHLQNQFYDDLDFKINKIDVSIVDDSNWFQCTYRSFGISVILYCEVTSFENNTLNDKLNIYTVISYYTKNFQTNDCDFYEESQIYTDYETIKAKFLFFVNKSKKK
jgi:hypothetical protein